MDTQNSKIDDDRFDFNKNDHLEAASEDIPAMLEDPFSNVSPHEILKELRYRIYKLIKQVVGERHDAHICRLSIYRSKKMLSDYCSDNLDHPICLNTYQNTFGVSPERIELLQYLSKIPFIGYVFYKFLSDAVVYEYQYLENLVICGKTIVKELTHYPIDVAYKGQLDQIKEELRLDTDKLEGKINTFVTQFSRLVGFIRTKSAAYSLVDFQKKEVEELEHKGFFDESEKEAYLSKLD